jgi:hypothetical protein
MSHDADAATSDATQVTERLAELFVRHADRLYRLARRLAPDAEVASTRRMVYLHPEAIVGNDDITGAAVVDGAAAGAFGVDVSLAAGGAERLRRATSSAPRTTGGSPARRTRDDRPNRAVADRRLRDHQRSIHRRRGKAYRRGHQPAVSGAPA